MSHRSHSLARGVGPCPSTHAASLSAAVTFGLRVPFFSATLGLAVAVGLMLTATVGFAAEAPRVAVGVAAIDITPDYPIRLSGFGARRSESTGIEQRLYAKALAFGQPDAGSLSILLTVDNTGIPAWMTEEVHARLARELPLRREQFALCSSHTHSAPMLRGMLPNLFSQDLTPAEQQTINRYSDELTEMLVQVAREAVANVAPSELWWGVSEARFAANRRTPGGPVDHDVPVLAVKGAQGAWRAVLANYACHCTTLGSDFNRHHGDWAGEAQAELERRLPGARAMIAIGCGADSNPTPRGTLAHVAQYGREIATQVEALLQTPMRPLPAPPEGRLRRFDLAFDTLPTRAEWEARRDAPGITGYHARVNLARLDRGETLPTTLPYSVQTWVFGEGLAMVFLPGEVVVDYSLRLKREYARDRLWVNAYANDVPAYIPSVRIWEEGGYEGGGAMPYYDRPTRLARDTEDRIFRELALILPTAFRAADPANPQPPTSSPTPGPAPAGR